MQEEVEMMVESLLDVLLQTLLSIMSKSHSVETSRGQRCPQCTAEITVSKKEAKKSKKKKNPVSEFLYSSSFWLDGFVGSILSLVSRQRLLRSGAEFDLVKTTFESLVFSPLRRGNMFPASSLCSSR